MQATKYLKAFQLKMMRQEIIYFILYHIKYKNAVIVG